MGSDKEAGNAQLVDEARRVRPSLGRSDLLIRLFDFLLDRSLADKRPKEIEIAQEVFGKSTDFDMALDASVRVYVHRLRRKIDDHYMGFTGPRLAIPKGEYRLTIEGDAASADAVPDQVAETVLEPFEEESVKPTRPYRRWRAALVVLAIVANIAAWLIFAELRPVDANRTVAQTMFWRSIGASGRPAFVVTGDFYLFGEAPDRTEMTRLVREFAINSREDLDRDLMAHPDEQGRRVDVDLHYLPTSTARALRDLLPIANAASKAQDRPWLLTGSELTPETLKGVNVLYIGFLSSLGLLRDPLFDVSGFKVGESFDELVDRASGKRYVSDWGNVADNRRPRRDYAYIASVPGVLGNRMLIVAGTRDAGVMQAAEIASDEAQLDQIAKRTGGQESFEALYEVRTLGNVNLGSTLVVARPLKAGQRPSRSGREEETFPDEMTGDNRIAR